MSCIPPLSPKVLADLLLFAALACGLFFAACSSTAAPAGDFAATAGEADTAAEASASVPEVPTLPPEARGTLAILPFSGGKGNEGETIAELFSFEPALTGVFRPVPRTSINQAIQGEQRFQMESGMTDPDTIAALGKQLGARYVVSGSITALGSQKLLVIGIFRIDDLRQIAGDVETYGTLGEIQDNLPAMARTIATAAAGDVAGQAAAKLPRLALPPVALSGGADKRDADTLARILAVNIINTGKYAVYPRTASLEQIKAEHAAQLRGDTADEQLADMGRGANPELVLSVTARKLEDRNMFNAAVINLVTGVQEDGRTVDYERLDNGVTAMEDLAAMLGGLEKPDRIAAAAKHADAFAKAITAAKSKRGDHTIILRGDFAADPVFLWEGTTVTVKGDGRTRTITNKGGASLFIVMPGATLILERGVSLDGGNKDSPIVAVTGGELVMKAGSTLWGAADDGVHVYDSGRFTMEGGTIRDNGGGGVWVASLSSGGNFIMKGGTISGNTAKDGGGVRVSDGSFTMEGGTISGNTAKEYGGGVYVWKGSFTMEGGTISGNTARYGGGGVFVNSRGGGTFIERGGTIDGNQAAWGKDSGYSE